MSFKFVTKIIVSSEKSPKSTIAPAPHVSSSDRIDGAVLHKGVQGLIQNLILSGGTNLVSFTRVMNVVEDTARGDESGGILQAPQWGSGAKLQ